MFIIYIFIIIYNEYSLFTYYSVKIFNFIFKLYYTIILFYLYHIICKNNLHKIFIKT